MIRESLLEKLILAGPQDSNVLVQLPTGGFALIKSVELAHGEIVITTTLNAMETNNG